MQCKSKRNTHARTYIHHVHTCACTHILLCDIPSSDHLFGCLAGVELTGMYLNPINATNQTFGCHGTGTLEHLVVYWGAPFVATACACAMQRHLLDIWKTMAADVDHTSRIECNNHQSVEFETILKTTASENGDIRHRSNTDTIE